VGQSQSHIATDGQSVSKSWCQAPSGAHDQIFITLFAVTVLFFVGRPLSREDESVFYICCWPLPAQSLLGPSPLVLAIIFYCLRFETSHFVASYDSQGHGGGIRPRLHTGSPVVFKITLRHGPQRKHIFPYCCVFVVTCLSSRCLGMGCVIPLYCCCVT
jgi:hypothetical protein